MSKSLDRPRSCRSLGSPSSAVRRVAAAVCGDVGVRGAGRESASSSAPDTSQTGRAAPRAARAGAAGAGAGAGAGARA